MKPETIWVLVKSSILIVAFGIFAYGAYIGISGMMNYFGLKTKLIKEEMLILSKNMASQKVEFDTEKLENRIELLNKTITNLVESRNQDIVSFGKIVSRLESSIIEGKSELKVDEENQERTYDETLVYTNDSEGNKFPIAHVLYNPFLKGDEKWTSRPYPIKFTTQLTLGESDDRKDLYVHLFMENDDIKEYRGKKFPLTINEVEWIERPPKDKEFMFNPRVSLGASIGTKMYPNLGLSFYSYGRTIRDMDWAFLRLGAGANTDSIFFQLSPAEYNIGNHVPVVENLFFGPFVGYGLSSEDESKTIYGGSFDIPF
jgi:hypothetical protein